MRPIAIFMFLIALGLSACGPMPPVTGNATYNDVGGGGNNGTAGKSPGNQCNCSSSPTSGEHTQTGTSTGNSYGGTSPSTNAHDGATSGGTQTGKSGGFGPKSS